MLEIQIDPSNPADVSVSHVDAVIPASTPVPHIREVKAALAVIKQSNHITKYDYVCIAAIEVLERFVNTR